MAQEVWLINMVFNFILLSSCFQVVWGYYCEWDLCGSDQYCCGDNLCCDYVYSLWYFWVGILFVVILLSACGGLFRYCYYHSPQLVIHRVTSYVPVPNVGAADDAEHLLITDNHSSFHSYSAKKLPGYFSPQGPPPPYSATISSHTAHSKHNTDGNLSIYP